MADDKNMNDVVDSMLNDVFSDTEDNSLSDSNSDLFSLLGMSDEEIKTASDNLAKEDAEWKSRNATSSSSSQKRAQQEAADYIKRANETEQFTSKQSYTAEAASEQSVQDNDMENDAIAKKQEAASKKQQRAIQKQQKKEEKLAKKQAKKEARLAKKKDKQSVKQIIEDTTEQKASKLPEEAKSYEVDSNINIDELFADDAVSQDLNEATNQENAVTSSQVKNAVHDNTSEKDNSIDSDQEKTSIGSKASQLFFGAEEEDDVPTAEEIAKKEAKKKRKEEKKEAKLLKQAQKKEQRALDKSKAKEMAVIKKAAKKDKLEKIRLEEEEEDAKEKRIKGSSVFMVGSVLTALGIVVICGTSVFDYNMVMIRSSKYVEKQKYKLAYKQISGVNVKEKDEPLRDKIYCVMYVQQQLDSYYNFCKLGMYENGLDSLVKGLKKYNLHYEEAVALGVASELDQLKVQIETELQNQFGIAADTAFSWIALDPAMYSQTIKEHVTSLQFNTKQDFSINEKEITKNSTNNNIN